MKLPFLLALAMAPACSDYQLGSPSEQDGVQSALMVEPSTLDFGLLEPGESASAVVTVSSIGTAGLELAPLQQTGSGAFSVVWDEGDPLLEPGESREVVVTYSPVNTADEGLLLVSSDAGEGAVALFGGGLYPAIAVDPGRVELLSETGAPVEGQAWVESVGTAPLELGTWLLTETEVFEVSLDAPLTLEPGEGTWLDVLFTPTGFGAWSADLTIATNTPTGQAVVPILGEYPPPCVGLSEAWDRGFLDLSMDMNMDIILTNTSEDYDLCVDAWYVYIGTETQDAAAGDPFYDPSADYPLGTIRFGPGESWDFSYGKISHDAWWCIEQEQETKRTEVYEFTGSHPPPVLLDFMLDGDQDGLWAWIKDHPAVLVGRNTGYLHLLSSAPSGQVELETRNLGRQDGLGWIEEHVPVGYRATGFSTTPSESGSDGAGGAIYRWQLDFDGAIDTERDTHTVYDIRTITYTLTVTDPTLYGRQLLPAPTAEWQDSSGAVQTSSGSPLVVEIQ